MARSKKIPSGGESTPPASLRRPRKASLAGGQGTGGKLKKKLTPRTQKLQKLSDNHRIFIAEYLIWRNASKAYRKAFPDCSLETSNSNAARLMSDPLIRAPIEEEMQRLWKKYAISAERVTKELGRIAFSDIGDIYGDNDKLLQISEMPPEVRAALKARYWTEHGERVELFDKMAALTCLGRHFALFNDSIEMKGDDEVLKALREAQARSAAAK